MFLKIKIKIDWKVFFLISLWLHKAIGFILDGFKCRKKIIDNILLGLYV